MNLQIKNNTTKPQNLIFAIEHPTGWKLSRSVREKFFLQAGKTKRIKVTLVPASSTPLGYNEIEVFIQHGGEKISKVFVVELVKVEKGFIDTGDDASLWKNADPPIPIRSENGKLILGPKKSGWGIRQRGVCIDVDEYPTLSIKVDKCRGALWALWLYEGGKHYPEPGIRLQQETWQTGIFHYDIKKITGWKGIRKFNLRIVPSLCGPNREIEVDWLKIGK